MSDTVLRQLSMLREIPRLPRKISVENLFKKLTELGYEVDLRTVQRDLVKLSGTETFQIISDGSKPAGWSWKPNAATLDIPSIDPQTALVFHLVEEHMRTLLPSSTLDVLAPWFETAHAVIGSSASKQAAWPEKIRVLPKGPAQRAPEIPLDVENTVYQALLEDKQLLLAYRRRTDPTPKDYQLSPLGLVVRDRLSYLVGLHNGHIKQFSLHRIQAASLLEEAAIEADGFDLDTYIASGEFGWPVNAQSSIRFVADFIPHAAVSLEESPLSDDQIIEPIDEDYVRITATVQDTHELRAWLRSFGDAVEILEPALLREAFRDLATTLTDYYEDEP